MSDELDRLEDLQDDLHDGYGTWTPGELAGTCAAAAAVPGFGGDAGELDTIAECCDVVAATVQQALTAAEPLLDAGIGAVWAGDTQVTATEALTALTDDMSRALAAFRAIGHRVREHAGHVRTGPADAAEAATLAATAGALTADADVTAVRAAHARATAAVDSRVARHIAMRDAAEDFATALHEIETQARAARLSDSPLAAVDEVVIAGAGWTRTSPGQPPVLTPAMDRRAAEALAALGDDERERMTGLLAAARSPEHRAYLLKTLAAGYPVADVATFDQLIAGHGHDPAWLDEHLSPLALDADTPRPGKLMTGTGATRWSQGNRPTCVAASTVTARAEVDPLYALQLTTGGHPDDPAFDNPAAFADRLRQEQTQVYDDGRTWFQEHFGGDGMTSAQSASVANEQIAPHTGATYSNVELADVGDRAATVPSIERAVDEGYPVPFFTREHGETHQMLVIGHSGDRLQVYNPWGYSYWITEQDFVTGHVDAVDPQIPATPSTVRLPEKVHR